MLNKLLMLVLLGVVLYTHNLVAFFGMIMAYFFGVLDARKEALEFLLSTKKMLKEIRELIEQAEKENNKEKDNDKDNRSI